MRRVLLTAACALLLAAMVPTQAQAIDISFDDGSGMHVRVTAGYYHGYLTGTKSGPVIGVKPGNAFLAASDVQFPGFIFGYDVSLSGTYLMIVLDPSGAVAGVQQGNWTLGPPAP